MSLSDAGSPILDIRSEQPRTPPTSLKTSDRASLLHFFGFPLDLFGKVRSQLTTPALSRAVTLQLIL
jgi:hypothetical protein